MNFAQPGWLALLILLPVLAAAALLISRLRRKQWTAFVAPRLRDGLVKQSSSLPRWLALFFLIAACAASIVALARPRGDAGVKTEKMTGRNVMVALDISKSMRVDDVKPDRLTQAKVVIHELLEAMPNERIGLIGFAGTPYVYAPLTIDHSAVREVVDQIDEKWAPLGGSDLAGAVRLATETLKKTGQKNNALVIISDGEKHEGDLDAVIAEAEQAGIFIVAIGVGTEDGGFVPNPDFPSGQMLDPSGRAVISRLQTNVMRKLAEETNGRFTIAGSGPDIPALVKSVVDGLDAFQMEGRERRISIEFYQWLMLPAIGFFMASIVAGTRWRSIHAAVLVAGVFFIPDQADASDASKAKEALAAKNYDEARDAYNKLAADTRSSETQARYRLGEATAAYRAEDFRAARSAYSQALLSTDPAVQASGHLGIGNSLFQLGWKGLSGESYPSDPALVPDLNRFDTIVKEALAKLRESESPEEGDASGFVKMESLVTNWADAVRHYDSALSKSPGDELAGKNREMSHTYLKRLQELLDEEKQETEESMPQPQPGKGKSKEGEGEGEPQEGEGEQEGSENPGDKGEGDEESKDGSGEEGDQEKDGKNGKDKDKDKAPGDKDGDNPNESPQERAHRILKENSDLEKGPLTPGRREFRDAEKDW